MNQNIKSVSVKYTEEKRIFDFLEARKVEEQEHRKREIKKMIAHGEELIKQGAKCKKTIDNICEL